MYNVLIVERSFMNIIHIIDAFECKDTTYGIPKQMRNFFRTRKLNFFYAETTEKAKNILRDEKIDVLIQNVKRESDWTGIEFLKYIKEDESLNDIPIIILSAYPFGLDIKQKFKIFNVEYSDIEYYFQKPYDFNLIFKAMMNIILEDEIVTGEMKL